MSLSPPRSSAVDKRIRVLHVIGQLGGGGAERFVWQIASLTDRTVFDVSVCQFWNTSSQKNYASDLEASGIPVHTIRGGGSRNPLIKHPARVLGLARLLRRLRPDIVHLHLTAGLVVGAPLARLVGGSAIIFQCSGVHAQYSRLMFPVIYRLSSLLVDQYIDGVTASLAQHAGIPESKITTITGFVDATGLQRTPAAVNPLFAEFPFLQNRKVLLSVGRLHPSKGHADAIAAMPHILRQVPTAHLFVLGEGPEGVALQQLIEQQGLNDSVTLVGYRDDLHHFLSLADLLLRGYQHEGRNLTCAAALLHGVPVVGFDISCPVDVVTHGINGFLVPNQDVEALAAATVRLLHDEDLRRQFAARASSDAESQFDISNTVAPVQSLYLRVLQGRGDCHAFSTPVSAPKELRTRCESGGDAPVHAPAIGHMRPPLQSDRSTVCCNTSTPMLSSSRLSDSQDV